MNSPSQKPVEVPSTEQRNAPAVPGAECLGRGGLGLGESQPQHCPRPFRRAGTGTKSLEMFILSGFSTVMMMMMMMMMMMVVVVVLMMGFFSWMFTGLVWICHGLESRMERGILLFTRLKW